MSRSLSFHIPVSLPREDGTPVPILDIQTVLTDVCQGLEAIIDQDHLLEALQATLPDGHTAAQFWQALLLSARTQIEAEPAYTFVTARALLLALYQEVLTPLQPVELNDAPLLYTQYFPLYFQRGVEAGLLDPRLLDFDLFRLAQAIHPERDLLFTYPVLQTLYDRYSISSSIDAAIGLKPLQERKRL